MSPTSISRMILFPIVVALGNSWIYVCASNRGNVSIIVKELINEELSFSAILKVLDINPYNSHVQFWRDLNNP